MEQLSLTSKPTKLSVMDQSQPLQSTKPSEKPVILGGSPILSPFDMHQIQFVSVAQLKAAKSAHQRTTSGG